MAKRKSRGGPNRSKHIRSVLEQNKEAKLGDVVEAWKAAGHRGAITPTLYYQVKKKMGLTKGRRGKRGRPAVAAAGSAADAYLAIERGLDQIVAQAETLGDHRLAEAVRSARRRASSKLV